MVFKAMKIDSFGRLEDNPNKMADGSGNVDDLAQDVHDITLDDDTNCEALVLNSNGELADASGLPNVLIVTNVKEPVFDDPSIKVGVAVLQYRLSRFRV